MTPRRIAAPALHAGAPYAYATVTAPSDALVFCAGACPIDDNGRVVTPDDLEAQAKLAVSNLVAVLGEVGCGLRDVLRTTVYVATADHEELVRGWEAVRGEFLGVDPPSTLVGVSVLGYSGQRIEIEAIAAAATP
ncbi:MAG: RidA family protein [Acidimicrobiales bacterium]